MHFQCIVVELEACLLKMLVKCKGNLDLIFVH